MHNSIFVKWQILFHVICNDTAKDSDVKDTSYNKKAVKNDDDNSSDTESSEDTDKKDKSQSKQKKSHKK